MGGQGNSGLMRDVARHEEMLRNLEQRLGRLESLVTEVAQLRAEIKILKEDIKELKQAVEKLEEAQERQNGLYKWIIGIMLTFSASLLALVGALVEHLIK